MTTSSTSAPEATAALGDPVLVMVSGAALGSPQGSAAEVRRAPHDAAALLVTDFGVTRGDGVFETVGVFDGKPVNLQPHLRRLARSAALIELPELDLDLLARAVQEAIDSHAAVPELTLRILVTRGDENGGGPTAWIHARTAADYAAERAGIAVAALDRGLASDVAETSPWLLAGAKTLSYAINMAAIREAKRRGADDVLFISSDGWCLEGPTSTLLVERDGEFLTTPVSAGVLPGTSVASLFEDLRAQGAACREQLMRLEDVTAADAAWLLSSSRLAAPITRLDDHELRTDPERTARFLEVLSGKA